MKLVFNPEIIRKNPLSAYKIFNNNVRRFVGEKQAIDSSSFIGNFVEITDSFESMKKTDEINRISRSLIEFLVNQKQGELASIAYSVLIKLNKNNPKVLETLATNALAIAKRSHDPVHIAARAFNLSKLYEKTERGSEKHVKYLRIANSALKDICKNYSKSMDTRYHKVSRGLKPVENYEIKLCETKIWLAQYTRFNEPDNARYELGQAKLLLKKNKNNCNTETIDLMQRRINWLEKTMRKEGINK